MALTPIELRDATSSSHSLIDHRQSLLSTSQRHENPMDSSAIVLQHRSRFSRWCAPWMPEIICWIISLCFTAGLIIALVVFEGHALPDLPLGINPNAIIQVLATFSEFFMMIPVTSALGQMKWLRALQVRPADDFCAMDDASRGPWGSFLLIVRGKGGLIASFGAIITVTTVAIGTFVQQALKYDTIYSSSSEAFMPIAKYMNGTGLGEYGGSEGSTSGVDPEVQSAAYIGLFSPPHTDFNVSAQCNSGNCTWESYRTLAICNTCTDLSSRLKLSKVQLSNNNKNFPETHDSDYYTLPNGVVLNGLQFTTDSGPLALSVVNITTNQDPVHPSVNGSAEDSISSIAFTKNGSALLSVFAVGLSHEKLPAQPDGGSPDDPLTGDGFGLPVAFECLLQFCVKEMRAEFQNGVLSETLISTWTNNTQYSAGQISSLVDDTILQPPDSGDTFIATSDAVQGTSGWLSSLVNGNATVSVPYSSVIDLEQILPSQPLVYPFLAAMNKSTTGFPDIMDNLAKSFSRNLRTLSYQPPRVSGLAFSSTTRATIIWPWLVLPLFLLAASLAFLIIVMVETKRKGLLPWTNSILPSLFHGINKRPGGQEVDETEVAMGREARSLLVEFQPLEDGGRLVVTKP